MKIVRRMMVMACAAGISIGGTVRAGSLTPPGPPEMTMHTLTEIYDLVDGLQQQVTDMQQELNAMRLMQAASGMAETVGGMVLIPAGPFRMGDAFTEGDADERPVHTVTVSAFYMDQYEVTKALWNEVHAYATGQGYSFDNPGAAKGNSHPVHTVNWYDCVKWANARSQRDGLTPVYYSDAGFTTVYKTGTDTPHPDWSADGYRLPTEAEWEKAARGGVEARRFPWAEGNTISHARANYGAVPAYDYDVNSSTGYHPDYSGGALPHTSPVGSFAPNGYGIYDMAGNIYELCWDWYSHDYYGSSPDADPTGPAGPLTHRIARGGCWLNDPSHARVANRIYGAPDDQANNVGFRCARRP